MKPCGGNITQGALVGGRGGRAGREGGVGGGERVKGVCIWRPIGKNADKPAPGIFLA